MTLFILILFLFSRRQHEIVEITGIFKSMRSCGQGLQHDFWDFRINQIVVAICGIKITAYLVG